MVYFIFYPIYNPNNWGIINMTKLQIHGDFVEEIGVKGPSSILLNKNENYIAIKTPGHSEWVGRSQKRSYIPTETKIFKVEQITDKYLFCTLVIWY